MTDKHPLTDEIIEEIARFDPDEDDMRAAADWQLEQVVEFILKEDMVYYDDPVLLANYLKKAMRPNTTQENNNG